MFLLKASGILNGTLYFFFFADSFGRSLGELYPQRSPAFRGSWTPFDNSNSNYK